MVVTGLDVNAVLHQHSPLEAQLQAQATLNIVPAYAWCSFSRERIRIETPPVIIDSIPTLISNGKNEVIYGSE
jgi:hypothetical protein